jgi:putative phage-type endonuclease
MSDFGPDCELLLDKPVSEMTVEEWRTTRHLGIGGSDSANIMGLSEYGTGLSEYLLKTGVLTEKDMHQSESMLNIMKWGNLLEPIIRDNFQEDFERKEQKKIVVVTVPFMLRSVKYPWMIANLDGLAEVEQMGRGVLEVKSAGWRQAINWEGDLVPDSYFCQAHHYMVVTGLRWTLVPYWIDRVVKWKFVHYDHAFAEVMIEAEARFWNEHVIPRIPPEATDSDIDRRSLDRLYFPAMEADAELPPEFVEVAEEWKGLEASAKELKAKLKVLDARQTLLENRIKEKMGKKKHSYVGPFLMTWSRWESQRVDTDKLKKFSPEVYKQVTYKTPGSRFSLKKKGEAVEEDE